MIKAGEKRAMPRILLIAPVGEGVGGMISQANALVCELNQQQFVDLRIIDSAQRYREYHDNAFLSRAWGGGWQALKRVSELFSSLVTYKPEAVQIWSSASLGLFRDVILIAIARMMGAKTFVSFHFGRIPQLASKKNWEWRLLGWVVRMADGVQVLDLHSKAVLEENHPTRKIRQFPNAMDLKWIDEICLRIRVTKTERSPCRLVFAGMVLPSKGVIELVDVCSQIRDIDFEVDLVGPYGVEMKKQLCTLAARRDEGKWLIFSGALSREEAVGRIAAADVFVLPSHTEGFPGVVLEAMACSVAIVATSVGAIPEMLLGNNGEAAGLLVPAQNGEALKIALEDLLRNPAKRLELGSAARRKCETHYRLTEITHQWVKLWTEQVPRHRQEG
jgi:glycosyltransferase involved in cell wall biosynthesis